MPIRNGHRLPSVVVDAFERRGGVPDRLRALGTAVEFERLPAGDYALGGEVLIERKTVLDLHASLLRGRLWAQLGAIRETSRYPHLIVEGLDLDSGPVSPEAIRGACLAAMRLGVRLLRTADADDSALWIARLAMRERRATNARPLYTQRRRRRDSHETAEAMLAAVPGVSTVTARALLARFGSVVDVLEASEAELKSVGGVGRVRARAIERVATGALRQRAARPHS